MFQELKNLCILHLKGLTEQQLKLAIIQENLFQTGSLRRRKELGTVVLKRMYVLDAFLIGRLVNGDIETGKMIALYSIMKTDALFLDFMVEMIADKLSIMDLDLNDQDFVIFFERKQQQNQVVRNWSKSTLHKLAQVYIRILVESGLLRNKNDDRELIRPIIDPDVKDYLAKFDIVYMIW